MSALHRLCALFSKVGHFWLLPDMQYAHIHEKTHRRHLSSQRRFKGSPIAQLWQTLINIILSGTDFYTVFPNEVKSFGSYTLLDRYTNHLEYSVQLSLGCLSRIIYLAVQDWNNSVYTVKDWFILLKKFAFMNIWYLVGQFYDSFGTARYLRWSYSLLTAIFSIYCQFITHHWRGRSEELLK